MPSLKHEKLCLAPVAGVDEAGRGPLAGPVVAAAVILPAKGIPRGIDDSKKLAHADRARLHDRLRACAIVGIGIVEAEEIDTLNIYWATMKAMTLAVEALGCAPGHVLVDGNRLPKWGFAATPIVKGDSISLSIAAASIIAKHTRDTIMLAHAEAHPQYGWHSNKGYGAPDHLRALREHGPCPLHRRSFAPVAEAYRARETLLV
ncbi:MAG: ribonuclease HII [Sphingomonas sp.]|jgi:ribonuclease HII|uniref:ribonuclease HII n=1 Tax=unclassified Sphingomonas TaxID=196159 RepID=UPI00053DED73|nr:MULTISPECIES: ribonuclease HII [unclassified Sphingomonas]MDR6848418.1 ribonuclease HII [Sphingomonas sp. BE137]MDR7259080.1 ribonuclease HII [Sphingomonas sp. BE270]RUN77492.1 ribonuclease HII [Sphingomonas sp. TF3]